jgi:hypothetical protein
VGKGLKKGWGIGRPLERRLRRLSIRQTIRRSDSLSLFFEARPAIALNRIVPFRPQPSIRS